MRLIAFVLLFCFALPMAAHAADIFVKPKNSGSWESPQHKGPVYNFKPKPKAEAPKLPPSDAPPAPAISNEMANNYYKNCISKEQSGMTPESQKELCACTAGKMVETMKPEEIQAMGTDTPEGQTQRDRMTLFVYMPCMEYPTRDLLYDQCVSDQQVVKGMKRYKEVCTCLAENMGKYVGEKGAETMAERVMRGEAEADPAALINAFMESTTFQEMASYHITTCTQKHEFGW
jgi:hypothetical protein